MTEQAANILVEAIEVGDRKVALRLLEKMGMLE